MNSTLQTLLTALLAVLSFATCRQSGGEPSTTQWPTAGAEADRQTQRIERLFADTAGIATLSAAIDSLRRASTTNPKRLKGRALYWEGRLEERKGNTDSAILKLESSLRECDSTASPYDYRRIRIVLDRLNGIRPIERYSRLIGDEEFFKKCSDLPMQANVAQQLGNIFITTLRYDDALECLLRCDSLLEEVGMETYRVKNRINTAMAYYHCGDSARADSTLRPLLTHPSITSDRMTHNIVLRNMHVITGDRNYIHEAYRLLPHSQSALAGTYAAILSDNYYNDGLADSAHLYASIAFNHLALIPDYNWKAMALECYGKKLRGEHKADSLVAVQDLFISTLDSLQNYRQTLELDRLENERGITGVRERMELERQKQKNRFLTLIIVVIMVAACAITIIMRRYARQKLKHVELELQTEKDRRKLLSLTMMMEEKDGFIDSLKKEVSQLNESRPSQETSRLEALMKANESGRITREYFFEAFERLNPEFIPRLQERCPGLPESLLQLACLIVTGVDNRRIAEILNIRASSVNQSRWRLRTRLGIEKEDSLEDELRKLIS